MHLALISVLLVAAAQGYMYKCLDGCECDTTDETIHCHNGERTSLALPESGRLRGFHVIGLTFNDVTKLPAEDVLKEKFPDVLAIDVERNPNFDCSSVVDYSKIKIISDCYKNITDISQVPDMLRPTKECDLECTAKKHYDDLHKYVMKLWEIIKEKYRNFDKDTALEQIKTFFIEGIQSINRKIDKSLDEFHPRNQKKVVEAVSPAAELPMVTEELD